MERKTYGFVWDQTMEESSELNIDKRNKIKHHFSSQFGFCSSAKIVVETARFPGVCCLDPPGNRRNSGLVPSTPRQPTFRKLGISVCSATRSSWISLHSLCEHFWKLEPICFVQLSEFHHRTSHYHSSALEHRNGSALVESSEHRQRGGVGCTGG